MTEVIPAPAGTLGADPMFAAFAPEIQGVLKNKGWDAKPINEALQGIVTSYQESEKFNGVPKELLVRLPKDAQDEAGRKALFARLGVPDDAKGYDFSAVKRADGTAADEQLVGAIAPTLVSAGVPKDRAAEIVAAVVKHLDGATTNATAEAQAKIAVEKDALAKNWGTNQAANMFIAQQALNKLGLKQEAVDALEKSAGYLAVMEMMLKLGVMMKEDKFVSTPEGGTPGVLSKEQARARMTELKSDEGWLSKYNKGDVTANREYDALMRIVAS